MLVLANYQRQPRRCGGSGARRYIWDIDTGEDIQKCNGSLGMMMCVLKLRSAPTKSPPTTKAVI